MTTKTRRSHRKSRNGCAECKHRHIRCDERRPACANCKAADRLCSFSKLEAGHQNHGTRLRTQQEATVTQSPRLQATSRDAVKTVENGGRAKQSPIYHLQTTQANLSQALDHLSHPSVLSDSCTTLNSRLFGGLDQTSYSASPLLSDSTPIEPSDHCPGLSCIADADCIAIYSSQHMVLMHHTTSVPDLTKTGRNVVEIAIRHAINAPYLLDEVLAFTAFYISDLYPGSAKELLQLATELQNRALASFTQLTENGLSEDKAIAVPRFLFSAILGRHVLADTVIHCQSDFHIFIDRFFECINLNRGVRAVMSPDWNHLNDPEVQPFINIVRQAGKKIVKPGKECDPLYHVIHSSDLNEASIKAYREAVDVLQWCFDLCQGLEEEDYLQSASVFSVRIGSGYADTLRKQRPEALLILAYYGVLLHRCRNFWAFHNAGASMVRAIADHLGSYWQNALQWPLSILEADQH